MNRRAFLNALTGSLFAVPLAVEAQPTPTVRRIGVVGGMNPDPHSRSVLARSFFNAVPASVS
jgi:hypothetical protein